MVEKNVGRRPQKQRPSDSAAVPARCQEQEKQENQRMPQRPSARNHANRVSGAAGPSAQTVIKRFIDQIGKHAAQKNDTWVDFTLFSHPRAGEREPQAEMSEENHAIDTFPYAYGKPNRF